LIFNKNKYLTCQNSVGRQSVKSEKGVLFRPPFFVFNVGLDRYIFTIPNSLFLEQVVLSGQPHLLIKSCYLFYQHPPINQLLIFKNSYYYNNYYLSLFELSRTFCLSLTGVSEINRDESRQAAPVAVSVLDWL
jgi:hypothetical protein